MQLVDELEKTVNIPTIIEFWDNDTKRALGMGLGRKTTILTYQDSLDPPYYISLGNAKAEGTFWFCYGQEESEYSLSNEVEYKKGLEAIKLFFEKTGRPNNISWEKL